MAKLALALLCAAFAVASARQLQQSPMKSLADLSSDLQTLNSRLAAAANQGKASYMSLLDTYETYDKHYGKSYEATGKYRDGSYTEKDAADKYYEADKYAPKYEKDGEYTPKYEKEQYGEYESKYDSKYDSKEQYEKEQYGEPKYGKDSHEEYAPKDYGYGPSKVTVKLFEKHRGDLRPQLTNANTFAFTSELTCQNPDAVADVHKDDGLIAFPIMADHTKLVTVGVCEWTITMVRAQAISEHATLKGNTAVVCTFNEEAERHCGHAAAEVLCDGMSMSGQGLVYNFDADLKVAGYGKDAEKYEAEKYGKYVKEPVVAEPVEPVAESMDVYLSLINGVINTKKHMKFDNGALQYFFGVPAKVPGTPGAEAAAYTRAEGDPTGQYTIVLKH